MACEVAVYLLGAHRRSNIICNALAEGILAVGDVPVMRQEAEYVSPETPIAVFYGFVGNLPKIMEDYQREGLHAVYIDLGYWVRRKHIRWDGYHKFSVNNRHPTAYFRNREYDPARALALGVRIEPWGSGKRILIAGMSDRGAVAEGFAPEEWERQAIAAVRQHTDRPITYRPKPSWDKATPIAGVGFSSRQKTLDMALKDCHAVVTHHSNVAVDGLIKGIPAFCWHGVAAPMGSQDLSKIEEPMCPEDREEWAAAVAWTQFDLAEMREGLPWRHLKDEGVLP